MSNEKGYGLAIFWTIEDGFVGNGQQVTKIPVSDLLECDNLDEVEKLVYEYIDDDFALISYGVNDSDMDSFKKEFLKLKKTDQS